MNNQGWECPKCGAVWAPFIAHCNYCTGNKPAEKVNPYPSTPTSADPLPQLPVTICGTIKDNISGKVIAKWDHRLSNTELEKIGKQGALAVPYGLVYYNKAASYDEKAG